MRGTVGEGAALTLRCHSRKWECIASALVVSLYQKFYHPYILQWTKPTTEKVLSPRIYFLARPSTTLGW